MLQVANISPAPVILGIIWLEMYNLDINWVTKRIFFHRPECREHLFSLIGFISVLPLDPGPTVGSPEMPDIAGPPESIKFLDPSNSLILYFIKNTTLAVSDPTTLLALPGLPYVTSITAKFDKTPAQIPLHYYNFLDIFGEVNANTLPPHRLYVDYAINLVPG